MGQPLPCAPSVRVLLAEDDSEMRRLLTRALTRDGHKVVAVENGLALLALLHADRAAAIPFDLLVTDLRMPGMGGLAVIRELRAWGSSLPILLITAFSTEETLAMASDLNVAAVFSKPFDIDDLRTAVLYVLDGSRCRPGRLR